MEFFDPTSVSNLPVDYGDIAMSRGQARQIIDRFTQEAVKKNITPDALYEGLYYLGQVGQSPDFSRSMIRNTLKSPMGSLIVENPGLASQVVGQFGGMLQAGGVNPALAGKHMGLVRNLLQEAKKDNLLRSNVTNEEVRREIQQPMHGALQDWLKANQKNPAVADVLLKSRFGAANIGAAAATKFDLPRLALDF
jgi:hypothetical protein